MEKGGVYTPHKRVYTLRKYRGVNVLKIEELEALRLKDLEELDQEQCAEKMGISRQTFQRILNSEIFFFLFIKNLSTP